VTLSHSRRCPPRPDHVRFAFIALRICHVVGHSLVLWQTHTTCCRGHFPGRYQEISKYLSGSSDRMSCTVHSELECGLRRTRDFQGPGRCMIICPLTKGSDAFLDLWGNHQGSDFGTEAVIATRRQGTKQSVAHQLRLQATCEFETPWSSQPESTTTSCPSQLEFIDSAER
jgi:hypothetical protein